MIGKIVAVVLLPLAGFLGVVSVLVVLIGSLNPFNSLTDDAPAGGPAPGVPGVPGAVADIPAEYLTLYTQAAANCPGLDWSILAAIGKIETNHGRSNLPGVHSSQNASGARGPMQFLQPTFDAVTAKHPLPAGGASPPSPYNPSDAVHAASFLLCDNGARDGQNLSGAIWNYNHDNRYVAQVLEQARQYAAAAAASQPQQPDQSAPPTPGTDSGAPGPGSSPAADAAITYARNQIGRPYVWGGNGPEAGQAGFDCSGLTRAAYQAAGITLPRTADTQYHAGPVLPADQDLQPGDLVFYRAPGAQKITHVALVSGPGNVIQAPDRGKLIEEVPLPGKDYVGATRPASTTPQPPAASAEPAQPRGAGAFILHTDRATKVVTHSITPAGDKEMSSINPVTDNQIRENAPHPSPSALSWSVVTTPWEQGPGRGPHSEHIAAYERSVARQLEQLAFQVTPHTVLQVRNGFLGEAQRLQSALDLHRTQIVVGPVGGDPLSQPAANVFNGHLKFTLDKCQAYVNKLREQGDRLFHTARSYGHTEQEIKQSLEQHVKARQQEWRDVQEGHDRIARLPGLQREILDPPPAPPLPPEAGQNLPKGPS